MCTLTFLRAGWRRPLHRLALSWAVKSYTPLDGVVMSENLCNCYLLLEIEYTLPDSIFYLLIKHLGAMITHTHIYRYISQ